MKRFLLLSCIVGLFVLATLAAGEWFVRSIPNPYSSKHHWMLQHADSMELLILGSSHTYYGINPLYLNIKAYNLANVSQPYKYDYYLLTHYANHYCQLHTVILPVSYFSMFGKGFVEDSWVGNINYKIYMECPFYSDFSKYNHELSQPDVYRGKLLKVLMGEEPLNCTEFGWGNQYTLATKSTGWEDSSAKAAANRHTAKEWDHLEENKGYFEKIAAFCKEHNIQLILITTPTWHAYYDRLDSKQLEKMYEIIEEMKQKYGLPYYDYLKDARFEADDFWDSDHLSDKGAEKFTRILQQDLFDPHK